MFSMDILFNFDILIASVIFIVFALVEPFLEKWLHDLLQANPAFCLGWDYFFSPLLRAAAIVLFVYLAYPNLFGLSVAPTLSELTASADATPSSLLGVMFLVGLLLPMVPALNRHPEFVLPIQGALAVAYIFSWLTEHLHITTAYVWPANDTFLLMVLTSYLGHRLAQRIGTHLGAKLDQQFNTAGFDAVSRHVIELLAQLPVILIYGYGLGRQLAM